MGVARVIQYGKEYATNFPVSGAGTALVIGQIMKRGPTAGTNTGFLIQATGAGAHPDCVGVLMQTLVATTLDTDTGGTIFTLRPIDLFDDFRAIRLEYSLDAADDIDATQAVTTTTITLTSLEDDIDAGFLYVVRGTGIGQTNFLTASAAGSATLKAAFGTNLDTTARLVKILPRFHQTAQLTSAGTRLASAAAAGSINVVVLDTFIVRNGQEVQMSPVDHAALTGLDSYSQLSFEADVAIQDTFAHPID